MGDSVADSLERARAAAGRGAREAAQALYLAVLRADPGNFAALNELGVLARGGGHRAAARSALAQAVRLHPDNPLGRINLGNLLLEEGELAAARAEFTAALAVADQAEAHQGLARVLTELGEDASAHWEKGFRGHAIVRAGFGGTGARLLLLVAARGGNIPTRHLIDPASFDATAVYADYVDPGAALPPHDLIFNAIGDADLCGAALARAAALIARSIAPVINPPRRVQATGRAATARRLAGLPDVVVPETRLLPRAALADLPDSVFPLLLRAPGYQTGRFFSRVGSRGELADAAAALPGGALLAIEWLDARGADGLARKYRVMCIDGTLYPLHLAISADWKVHYFTAGMLDPAHRAEEARFLADMPGVLGARAMVALGRIFRRLGLDYAGIDFALGPEGQVLLFEANAAMVIARPGPEPIWDHRRPAIDAALAAVRRLLLSRAGCAEKPPPASEDGHVRSTARPAVERSGQQVL